MPVPAPRSRINQEYPAGKANHPVADVTWYEAAAYAEFVGKCLPAIFQWEKAARDGAITRFEDVVMPYGRQCQRMVFERSDCGLSHDQRFPGRFTLHICALWRFFRFLFFEREGYSGSDSTKANFCERASAADDRIPISAQAR